MASCSTSSPLQEPGFAPTIPVLEPAVDDTGRLEGQVLFEGSEIPAPTLVANTTDPQHCGKVHSLEDVLVEREGRGIQNVILALKDVILPEGYSVEPGRLLLDNRNCRFMPHAAVLTTGSVLEATNSDPISHSVHLYGFRNINLALGPKSSKTVRVYVFSGNGTYGVPS